MNYRSVTAKLLGAMAAMIALDVATALVGQEGGAVLQTATRAVAVILAVAIAFFLYAASAFTACAGGPGTNSRIG